MEDCLVKIAQVARINCASKLTLISAPRSAEIKGIAMQDDSEEGAVDVIHPPLYTKKPGSYRTAFLKWANTSTA